MSLPTAPETCILDLDGPLLDGRFRHHACYSKILERHGFQVLPIELYWQMKRDRADRRVQLAATGAETLYDTFLSEWLDSIEMPEMLALDVLQPGALETLEDWRSRGLRLILATQRQNHAGLNDQIQRLGLARCFDLVLPCEHAGGGAGKASRVRQALDGRPATACIWIGDTEVDIEAARALGCPIWAVTCGLRTEAFLSGLDPDWLVADITKVELPFASPDSRWHANDSVHLSVAAETPVEH